MDDQFKAEFEALAGPLLNWFRKNAHPHMTIIIGHDGAELLEGVVAVHRPQINDGTGG